ncbi:hypothetical protein A6C57_08000 [Fibrella sp. ES10-3-2-2]
MKTLVAIIGLTLFSVSLCWGQTAASSLNTDPSFRQSLTAVRYPILAQLPERVPKVYINFSITKEGKVTDIKLLKTESIDTAFIEEVNRLAAQLPNQKAAYAGEYVLPIVFDAKPKSGVRQPTVADRAAFDRTFIQLSRTRTLLNELYVAAK